MGGEAKERSGRPKLQEDVEFDALLEANFTSLN